MLHGNKGGYTWREQMNLKVRRNHTTKKSLIITLAEFKCGTDWGQTFKTSSLILFKKRQIHYYPQVYR